MESQITKKDGSFNIKKNSSNKRKTHEQFIAECHLKVPTIKIIGVYKKATERVLCKCLVCGHEWNPIAGSLVSGHGCPHCADIQTGKRCKKSHEQYVLEVQRKNPSVDVVGKYNGSSINIVHRCRKCGHEWSAKPANILSGTSCPRCANKYTKSNDEWLQEFHSKNTHNIIPLTPYVNSHTKITCRCNECKNIFSSSPYVLLRNSNCPKCAIKINARKATKTHQLFVEEIKDNNPSIEVVGTYEHAHKKIKFACKLCGYEWNATPSHVLHGTGCPCCNGREQLSYEQVIARIKNPTIKIVGNYINKNTRVLCKCDICGKEWYAIPNNLIKGTGCPNCKNIRSGLNQRKNIEDFKNEMKQLHPEIELLSDYKGANKKITIKIIDTDEVREVTPSALYLSGRYDSRNYKGEQVIAKVLDKYNIAYIHGKRFNDLRGKRNPLEYDFYLPKERIAIEFQGEQHFRAVSYFGGKEKFVIQQKHDEKKRDYAKNNNIRLIEIKYFDFDNIEEILIKELKLGTAETAG